MILRIFVNRRLGSGALFPNLLDGDVRDIADRLKHEIADYINNIID